MDLCLRNFETVIIIIGRVVILAEFILETDDKPDRGLVRLGKNWGKNWHQSPVVKTQQEPNFVSV